MVPLIVIMHNQASNIYRMLRGIRTQSTAPDFVLFVLDDCSDESASLLTDANIPFVIVSRSFSGFGAGYARDFGVAYFDLMEVSGFVFLDGDCIPSVGYYEHHKSIISNREPVLCFGSRQYCIADGYITGDSRIHTETFKGKLFSPGTDYVMTDCKFLHTYYVTWSCAMSVNVSALLLVNGWNDRTYGCNRLFSPIFDGVTYGEDYFLGQVAMRLGVDVLMLDPDRSHVMHIDHSSYSAEPPTGQQLAHSELVKLYSDLGVT